MLLIHILGVPRLRETTGRWMPHCGVALVKFNRYDLVGALFDLS